MKPMKTILARVAVTAAVLCCAMASNAFAATDEVTIGTVTAIGVNVDVPVYIRDVSGTPLGVDQPPGSKIQSYSLKVNYAPASSVQSVTFTRAGITTSLTPTFESSPSGVGTITLLDTFQESTNPIPFTLNAAAPGNQVAHLTFVLTPAAAIPGSTIALTFDPNLTQLSNQGGTTLEAAPIATLLLINGAINVTAFVPAMSEWALILLVAAFAIIGMRLRT